MNKGNINLNILERIVPSLLGKMLPKRAKRMIFVSSFLAHIQNNCQSNKTLLSKLNMLMKLSSDDNALDLPMRLHNKIWGNIQIVDILREKNIDVTSIDEIVYMEIFSSQVRTVSEQIVKAAPEWLRYDSNTKMRADMVMLFKNLNKLLTPLQPA